MLKAMLILIITATTLTAHTENKNLDKIKAVAMQQKANYERSAKAIEAMTEKIRLKIKSAKTMAAALREMRAKFGCSGVKCRHEKGRNCHNGSGMFTVKYKTLERTKEYIIQQKALLSKEKARAKSYIDKYNSCKREYASIKNNKTL